MSITNKKIAITGVTGLIGYHLATELSKNNEVYGFLYDVPDNLSLPKINRIYGDVTKYEDVEKLIKISNPDYVFHLGAWTQALSSQSAPYKTFNTNVLGSLNVLEAIRSLKPDISSVVVASSDKTYGTLISETYTEKHPLNGIYPYDASKSMTDILCRSYRETYNLPVAVIRSCNIYGPADFNTQRIIPGLIESYITGKTFTVRNFGKDVREYLHVSDSVDAYMKVAEYASSGGLEYAFNLSSGEALSTSELVHIFEKISKTVLNKEYIVGGNYEIPVQVPDSSLIRASTGWENKKNLRNSLAEIIDWYKINVYKK